MKLNRSLYLLVCALGVVLVQSLVTSCGNSDQAPPPQTGANALAGLDANGDGVRDDIEIHIENTYPVSTQNETNKALRQYAKAVQSTVIHAGDPTASITHATERFRALECLMARRPADFHSIFVELRARLLDTTARSSAYLKADDQVKAVDIPVLPADKWGTACL
jgi:hypothetical protein